MGKQATAETVFGYVKKQYGTVPEYLWTRTPDCGVLRHTDNKKWYAIVMSVRKEKLGFHDCSTVYIINVKCDRMMIGSAKTQEGFFPAYHMNKQHWISVLLDGSVMLDDLIPYIDISYILTKDKERKTNGN